MKIYFVEDYKSFQLDDYIIAAVYILVRYNKAQKKQWILLLLRK